MYTIKARFPVNGKHWELEFSNGAAHTDSAVIAENYRSRGYAVTEDTQEEEPNALACPACGKAYKTASALEKHRKTHDA